MNIDPNEYKTNVMHPITLYKFMSYESFEALLKSKGVKLTEFSQANDPYEFMPSFDIAHDMFEFFYKYQLPKEMWLKIWYTVPWKKMIGAIMRDWLNIWENTKNRVVCMSARISSPVMWAHYAERSSGVCLVFKFNANVSNVEGMKAQLRQVTYTDSRVSLLPVCSKPCSNESEKRWMYDLLTRACLAHKSTDWAYEREYRLIVHGDENVSVESNGICVYQELLPYLHGVVLGAECSKIDEGETDRRLEGLGIQFHDLRKTVKAQYSFGKNKIIAGYPDMSDGEHENWRARLFENETLNAYDDEMIHFFNSVRRNYAEERNIIDSITLGGLLPPIYKSRIRKTIESMTGVIVLKVRHGKDGSTYNEEMRLA